METDTVTGYIIGLIFWLIVIVFYIYSRNKKKKEKYIKEKEDKLKEEKEKERKEKEKKERIETRLNKLKVLTNQISEIAKIHVNEVNEFKSFIQDNETIIIEKGGEDKLFQFLKLDTFLQDFRKAITHGIEGITQKVDEKEMEIIIREDENRNELGKIADYFDDTIKNLEGKEGTSFNAKLNRLFNLGNSLKPSLEREETVN